MEDLKGLFFIERGTFLAIFFGLFAKEVSSYLHFSKKQISKNFISKLIKNAVDLGSKSNVKFNLPKDRNLQEKMSSFFAPPEGIHA